MNNVETPYPKLKDRPRHRNFRTIKRVNALENRKWKRPPELPEPPDPKRFEKNNILIVFGDVGAPFNTGISRKSNFPYRKFMAALSRRNVSTVHQNEFRTSKVCNPLVSTLSVSTIQL